MANNQNLVNLATRPQQERQKIARMGQKAATEAKKRKATMREMLQECLNMTNNKGQTFQELATLGLIQGAIKGKALNYRTIVETLGELGPEASTNKENGILDELTEALRNAKDD